MRVPAVAVLVLAGLLAGCGGGGGGTGTTPPVTPTDDDPAATATRLPPDAYLVVETGAAVVRVGAESESREGVPEQSLAAI